ncbi:outer membrane efflux protein [Sandaracinus amylolyticus]|uniref:Outer membrane efflux protein n=1 Tax=Sandaracinus amylolyticus TaxID=927083 RepID=A0A0F6SFK7_9BACT|nr:outer membrane efflux protein [Sandaracinus amylolyticus]
MTFRAALSSVVLASSVLAPAMLVSAQDATTPPATTSDSATLQTSAATTPAEAEIIDVEAFLRGEGRGITAEDAARRAVETGPSIESVRAQLSAARAGADRAMIAFFPRLSVEGRYTRLSPISQPNLFGGENTDELLDAAEQLAMGVDDPEARLLWQGQIMAQREQASFTFPVLLDNWSFGGSLTVPVTDIFLQIWPSYEAAQGAVRAQRHQVYAQSSEVAQNARETFYAFARARGGLAVARAAVAAAELQAQLIEAMVRAGTSAQVDFVRVQAQVATARVAALRAEAAVLTSATALRTVMHVDPDEELAIAEDLLAPLPPVTGEREALVAAAYDQRSEVRALRELAGARGRQVDAAEGSRWPHLVLAGNLTTANPNQRIFPLTQEFQTTWDVSVVVSWSPNDFFVGEVAASEARAARSQVEADLRTLEDGIRIQVTQAYESLRAARAAIEAARAGVEAADETLRVRQEQYRAGATVVTELVLAVNERARAQLDLVSAALDARVAYSQLLRATGADENYQEAVE